MIKLAMPEVVAAVLAIGEQIRKNRHEYPPKTVSPPGSSPSDLNKPVPSEKATVVTGAVGATKGKLPPLRPNIVELGDVSEVPEPITPFTTDVNATPMTTGALHAAGNPQQFMTQGSLIGGGTGGGVVSPDNSTFDLSNITFGPIQTTNPGALQVALRESRTFNLFAPEMIPFNESSQRVRNMGMTFNFANSDFESQLRGHGYRSSGVNFEVGFEHVNFGEVVAPPASFNQQTTVPHTFEAAAIISATTNRLHTLQGPRTNAPAAGALLAIDLWGNFFATMGAHIHRHRRNFSFQIFEKSGEIPLAVSQLRLHSNPFEGIASVPSISQPFSLYKRPRHPLVTYRGHAYERHLDIIREFYGHLFPVPPDMRAYTQNIAPWSNIDRSDKERADFIDWWHTRRFDIHVSVDTRRLTDANLFYVVVPLFRSSQFNPQLGAQLNALTRANNFYLQFKIFPNDRALLYDTDSNTYVRNITLEFFGSLFGLLLRLGHESTFLESINRRAASKFLVLASAAEHE